MVTVGELETLFAGDHELRRMELKGPGTLRNNGRFVAKVARAAMAMGNLRDGGLVVLGIANDQIAAMQPGLNDVELAEWSDFDLVSASLSRYSDPPVSFELHKVTMSNGAWVVVLEVAEFEHDMHICKRDFEGVLQDGQTYVRARGEPRSVPVPSEHRRTPAPSARGNRERAIRQGVLGRSASAQVAARPLPPGQLWLSRDQPRRRCRPIHSYTPRPRSASPCDSIVQRLSIASKQRNAKRTDASLSSRAIPSSKGLPNLRHACYQCG